jgi:S1-C subfamily serine protease
VPELIRRKNNHAGLAEEQIAKKIGVSGVLIVDVARCDPAAKAEIRPTRRESSGRVILGDVITAVAARRWSHPRTFLTLENYKVGDAVVLALLRDGQTIQAKVPLQPVQ